MRHLNNTAPQGAAKESEGDSNMKWMMGTLVLLFSISMVAQQPDMHSGSGQLPQSMASNSEVRHEIQSIFDTNSKFNNTNLAATVGTDSVVLTGSVISRGEKEAALKLASEYAGERQIVDQIELGGSQE
jgi:osmotically-inducible protein OsmY